MDAAAAMVCDDVVFLLVGDGARRGELEEMAKERGLDQVMFTGQVEKGEIPALLRTVDVCLVHLRGLPLFRTVLPSKIFEAFATGKPIIVGVPGDASAVVLEAEAGIEIAAEDAEALVAAVQELRNDPERARQLGANGRRVVESDYNRDVLAKRFLEVIEARVLNLKV